MGYRKRGGEFLAGWAWKFIPLTGSFSLYLQNYLQSSDPCHFFEYIYHYHFHILLVFQRQAVAHAHTG